MKLQHAAALVVNMDLPRNPAVLEQPIGRAHRMNQSCGVQVVNPIGQGSIEEGILSLRAFEKSLITSVLRGGACEVVLQKTQRSSFMKSVEQVAGAMGVNEGADEGGQGGDNRSASVATGAQDSFSPQDAPQSEANLVSATTPAT